MKFGTKVAIRRWIGIVAWYVFAVAITAIAMGSRWWLLRDVGAMPLFITAYPGIFIVAVFAGGGPGLVNTFLSAMATDYYFTEPAGSFTLLNKNDIVAFIIFIGTGIFMCLMVEYYRQRQKKAIDIVKLATKYNRSLLESSLDPLVTISADGKITDVNEATVKVTGVPRDKLIGDDFSNYFTEPQKARQGYQEVFSKGFVSDYPLTIRHKDGKLTDVLYNASVYKDDRGNVRGVFAAARDVTLTKQASQYARSLIESSLDPLVTISADGKITDVNEAAVKVTGIPRDKLIGDDFSNYFTEPQKARQGYQEVFSKGFVSDYPLTIRHKDGKLTDVLYNATVYKDDRGNVLGVFAAARDVTKLNDLQDKLVRTEKLAIVGELASSVAHELRNPLGVVKNTTYYLGMLDPVKDNSEFKENIDIINQEIENSDRIIGDLLEFSRSKEPVFQPGDINQIIKEVLDRLNIPPKIELALELKDGLPAIEVDVLQMHQVFYNITKNGIEAMGKGGKFKIKAGLKDDGFLEASFSDTGPGISKENISKIFEPLFSTKAKGTGLGLSVCSSIIERHKGSIEVDSEVGKGTTFTVKLPIKRG